LKSLRQLANVDRALGNGCRAASTSTVGAGRYVFVAFWNRAFRFDTPEAA
jgi:hypothetical protein